MRSVAPAQPIAIRLFEPITLLFPEGAMPALDATIPSPNCLLCEGPASPPSRMGWLGTPERKAIFAVCGSCSDCDDAELERRIITQLSDSRPETVVATTAAESPPPEMALAHIGPQPRATAHGARATEAWVKAAAKAWATPAA